MLDDADLDRAVSRGGLGLVPPPGPDLHDHRPAPRPRVDRTTSTSRGSPSKADHLPVGDPATGQVALGPIIDAGQRDQVHALVTAQRRRRRAGSPPAAPTRACSTGPTVLADVTPDTPAYAQEVFGPVAPVMPFSTLDEAAALAADSEYGLSLGILTRDVMKGLALADRIPTGIVHINDQTVDDEAVAPFGGVARLRHRLAVRRRRANVEAFTETQWLTVRRARSPPYPF